MILTILAPLKLEPLLKHICLTFPLQAINLLSAWMNESVSGLCVTLIWTARQVNIAPVSYHFSLSLTMNVPTILMVQWMNGGPSLNLSLGKSAIICFLILPLIFCHVTHLNMADLITELPQEPLHHISLRSITIPLPL